MEDVTLSHGVGSLWFHSTLEDPTISNPFSSTLFSHFYIKLWCRVSNTEETKTNQIHRPINHPTKLRLFMVSVSSHVAKKHNHACGVICYGMCDKVNRDMFNI